MKIYPIEAGNFKLDGGAMFGVVPKTIWNKTNPADENNLIDIAARCLLIEEGNRLILIDTGMGTKQSDKFLAITPYGAAILLTVPLPNMVFIAMTLRMCSCPTFTLIIVAVASIGMLIERVMKWPSKMPNSGPMKIIGIGLLNPMLERKLRSWPKTYCPCKKVASFISSLNPKTIS